MEKIIYLVRHAQGEHNVDNSHHIQDAQLTPLGKIQCIRLRNTFLYHERIALVTSSPLKRAIETAAIAFLPALCNADVPFLLLPGAQEVSNKPCDVGHERSQLEEDVPRILKEDGISFDFAKIGFGLVKDEWNKKAGQYEAHLKRVEERAAALRLWLWKRPESHIVLITHGTFLHYLTEDWIGYEAANGTAYRNCEFRLFSFSDSSSEDEAHLVELETNGIQVSRPISVNPGNLAGLEGKPIEK